MKQAENTPSALPPERLERILPPAAEAALTAAMLGIYPPGFLQTAGGPETIEVEVQTRPYWFRQRYAPWLAGQLELDGARVLEIGAGTGAGTIPLAERGARVEALDIAGPSLEVTRVRAGLHGLAERIRLHMGNAAEIGERFAGARFDLVLDFAALEHMTYRERIATLRAAWQLLAPGGTLCAIDTPNRLWYFDNHTAFTNFFHWLPDEVAMDYAARTPRGGFNGDFASVDAAASLRLARWGRGVSYHDFEIALGSLEGIAVAGEWQHRRDADPWFAEWWAGTEAGRYHAFLRGIAPAVPVPWLEEEIAVALRKPI